MSERVLGAISVSSDVAASDLAKGRYFGLQPYINYRRYCTGRSYKTFWHLKDAITTEVTQLKAIRKVTVAGVLCEVGDSVTRIQPAAFESISKGNRITSCSSSKIGKLDLSAWKDPECS
ncbi:unnamed protein product [Chrysodeixis includens]|uniref:Uncharacterized protein n=1 Tax=Chrysodeixis includens TaxID=689277 RepID=A0A9N8L0W7_CHRIL|nr:unnamed protein product [Chrysodeixis includens]